MQTLRTGGGIIDQPEDLPTVGEKLLASGGQGDATVSSREQARADLLLKHLYLLAQRWLRNVQSGCGAPKMQFFRHGNKVTKVTQFNIHILNVLFETINILDRIMRFSYSTQQGYARPLKTRVCCARISSESYYYCQ